MNVNERIAYCAVALGSTEFPSGPVIYLYVRAGMNGLSQIEPTSLIVKGCLGPSAFLVAFSPHAHPGYLLIA